jgi:membrane-associated phospholipid phosphatase
MHAPSPQRERPRWYVEAPLLIVGYVLFGLARAAVDRGERTATRDAELVQRLERALHLAIEPPLNHAMLAHPVAMYATGYFYRLCVLAVPLVLIWLYVRQPAGYRRLRTVLVVMTLLDLLFVWLFPAAPPRLALPGIVDYMATYDILGGASLRQPSSSVNIHGAMPSMHIAWTTWCAYAVWAGQRERTRWAWLAWLLPLLTAFVVLATGHHYVLDILAGMTLVAVVVTTFRVRVDARTVLGGPEPADETNV